MTTKINKISSKLYEQDYNLWLEKIIQLLNDNRWGEIDLSNLIAELEGMSRSEKRAIYSNLKIVLMHLLKYKYQPERRSRSWLYTIREHRQRLSRAFKESPSLRNYFQDIFAESYQDARELAADETGLALLTFPDEIPFSTEEVLNTEYLPD
ncbi:MAG: DUF29 domain-containing protein [Microcoleaceae cyanobacterium]